MIDTVTANGGAFVRELKIGSWEQISNAEMIVKVMKAFRAEEQRRLNQMSIDDAVAWTKKNKEFLTKVFGGLTNPSLMAKDCSTVFMIFF